MMDVHRLRMTEIKLRNIKSRNRSLLHLAAKKIADNLCFYLDQEDYRMQLSNLTQCTQDAVLQVLLRRRNLDVSQRMNAVDFGRLLKCVTILLNSQTTSIDIDRLMSFCPSSCVAEVRIKVLQLIATRAPKLWSLDLGFAMGEQLGEPIVATICKLKNLRKLNMKRACLQFKYVKIICKRLKKLEVFMLRAVENFASDDLDSESDILDFKRCLKRLRVFHFQKFHPEYEDNSSVLRRKCIQHLPNLEFADRVDLTKSLDPIEPEFRIDLPSETSRLTLLKVAPSSVTLHESFPHVTYLTVQFFPNRQYLPSEIDTLLHFTKIRGLTLDEVPTEEVVGLFLEKYGKELREFHIYSRLRLQFRDIFNACPKMEKLNIQGVTITDDDINIDFFAELKDLEWLPENGLSSDRNLTLSKILAAPKLESVVVHLRSFQNVNLEDVKYVSTMIADQRILGLVKELKFRINATDLLVSLTPTVSPLFNALSDLCKNACAYLPNCVDSQVPLLLHCKMWGEDQIFIDPPYDQVFEAKAYKCLGDPNLAKFAYACLTRDEI